MINDYGKLPEQRISISKKDKEWFKKCALSGISIALESKNSIRVSNSEMIRNYRIYDGLANTDDLKKKFDSLNIVNANYSPTFSTYSTIRNQINLLVGEAIERGDEYVIACLDTDSINKKLNEKTQKVEQLINDLLLEESVSEEDIKIRLEQFKNSKFRSKEEVAANKALDYYKALNSIDYLKADAFRELLVTGGFIFAIDKVNDSLKIRQCNMLRTFPVRNGRSNDVRDSELIVEIRYLNKAAIIDEFRDDLDEKDLKRVMDEDLGSGNTNSNYNILSDNARKNLVFNNIEDLERFTDNGNADCTEIIDSDYNIRVARVVWAGYRKIFKRKYYDSNADVAYDFVSEFYKAKIEEGEVLKPLWIKEWHEATVIGGDIITKAKIKEQQYRSKTNPSECYSGYVGRFANIGDNKAKSLIDLVFPLLYLRDMVFARMEDIMAKNLGKVIELDISKKPKDWTVKKWLFWVKVHGIKIVDSFNEGDKGMAQNKLAGMYNTSSHPADMDISSQITNYLQFIQYIDAEIDKAVGIPPQRLGAISQRDAVSNVETSRINSSIVTEIWFNTFERGIIDLYEIIVEASKDLIGTDKKLQAVLDDYSYSILDSNDVDYKYSEIGIFPIKARKYARLKQIIEEISINAIPNGAMSYSQLFNLFRSNSVIEMMEKQERIEKENQIKAEKMAKEQQENQMAQIKAQQEALEKQQQMGFEHEVEMEKIKGDVQMKIEEMRNNAKLRELEIAQAIREDADGDGTDDTVEVLKARIDMENKNADRQLKMKEIEEANKIKREELKLKEQELKIKSRDIKNSNFSK